MARKTPIPPGVARQPRPNLSGRFIALTMGAGAIAAVCAQLGFGPFAGLQLPASAAHTLGFAAIRAQDLFPPARPILKVVTIYDPVAQANPSGGQSASAGGGGQPAGSFPPISFPAGPLSAIEAVCEAAKQRAENGSEAYKQYVEQQCEAAKQRYEQSHP